ncbi:thioredoxin family protein [Gimesia maris]|uniref:thioredoxin family protein n=1 Tax=Gimesia maris TaxID=122 RepID=UPI000C0964A0|nr:thioredoxin family protein [Gimesia maris]MAC55289.1 thioredoxin family protein [Gimesia sp.]|tara:strand:- start:64955 stop:65593 length:639 start_codon:yes stop_codon:yes gene_type:complete
MSASRQISLLLALSACCLLTMASPLHAGKYNPVLDVGDKAPTWDKLPATDGKSYSSASFQDKEVLVIAFTCNSCPYAVDYEGRLNQLAQKYSAKDSPVAVIAVNVNLVPADSLEKMKEQAAEKKFVFPYLFDESQKIGQEFGATRTPEFFVLNKERKVIYMGAMDDSTDASKVNQDYVSEAIAAALNGKQPKTSETIAIGCNVRYKRIRRKK